MTPGQIGSYVDNGGRYAHAVASAIDRQTCESSKWQFDKMVGGDIVFECTYELSSAMAARNVTVGCDRTLHAAECGDLNGISVG